MSKKENLNSHKLKLLSDTNLSIYKALLNLSISSSLNENLNIIDEALSSVDSLIEYSLKNQE